MKIMQIRLEKLCKAGYEDRASQARKTMQVMKDQGGQKGHEQKVKWKVKAIS